MNDKQQRISALEAWAAEEGIALPWPAATIVGLEAQGHVVDFTTGLVIQGGGDQRVSLTVVGEAVAVAHRAWEGGAA